MRHELDDILRGDLEPFRRIARSILEMAILTGVLVRVLHALFSAYGTTMDWYVFAGRFMFIPLFVLGMVAIHLSHYPVRQWFWRAPVFALIEAASGAVTSLILIALGRERRGTMRAEFGDWPGIASGIVFWHVVVICVFALVLGGVVQWIRKREWAEEIVGGEEEPGEEEEK